MIKIFSKLKHILLITVILITVLFGILTFRQYSHLDIRKLENETNTLLSLSRDFLMIHKLYQETAHTYLTESILTNEPVLDYLQEHRTLTLEDDYSETSDVFDSLYPMYLNANKNYYTYIKIYSRRRVPLKTISDYEYNNSTSYKITFPIHHESDIIGYAEFGLHTNAFINTLYQLTAQNTFTIYKKSELEEELLPEELSMLTESPFSDEYLTSDEGIEEFYNRMPDSHHFVFNRFASSEKAIMYEDLLKGYDFVVHEKVNGNYYSISFISINQGEANEGYFVHFASNDFVHTLHENLTVSLTLLAGLYLTLLIVIGFIYYILHYLYHFSYTDHLTKVYNRHKFFDVIPRNIYDYHRYNYMFSVILIDIDNFKNINDTLGHNTGDQVLINLVNVLKESLRTTDYLFRWGGEEFLVLLSHCDKDIGYQVSEKLRKNVEEYPFNLQNNLKVTASFGVASYEGCDNIETLISHADKALYHSKENGKNKTTMFPFDKKFLL